MLICPAVHIPTRSLLRSSSTPEPSDPPYSIVFNKRLTKTWPFSQKTVRVDSSSRGGDQQSEPGRGRRALSGLQPSSAKLTARRTQEPGRRQSTVRRPKRVRPRLRTRRSVAGRQASDPRNEFPRVDLAEVKLQKTDNDPSAGSPTETLLRLLLPLNAQVWESFRATTETRCPRRLSPNTSLKRSIGSSDGRCVQRAGT